MQTVDVVCDSMKTRREISVNEMEKILQIVEQTDFNVEVLTKQDQERLSQALIYLLKFNSGLDSQGNFTNRYGLY
jgi:hypothetical protein